MVIRTIEVRNFRSLRDASLECNGLTAIVGKNGAGKSCFLAAVGDFYNTAAALLAEDFYGRDTNQPIEIRVTYGHLSEEELSEFETYVRRGELTVTKRISVQNGRIEQKYYAADKQIPAFAAIRAETKGHRDNFNALVREERFEGLSKRATNAPDAYAMMAEYEQDHSDLLELVEREEQFFGPPNVGGGKLDKYTRFVLVPAVRDASDETQQKRGAVLQLLDTIVARKVNAREDIQKFKTDFEERARQLYSCDNLTELPELGVAISEILSQFWPGARLNLKWGEPAVPTIPLPGALVTLVEDDFEGDVARKGHGLQRALILTLLQYLGAIPEQRQTAGQSEDDAAAGPADPERVPVGPDLIIGIEEPELYLHPSRCRFLAQLLLELASDPGLGAGEKNQVIYTTHSPHFVALDRFEQVRIASKVRSGGPFPSTRITSYSRDQASARLAEICGRNAADFTRQSFRAHAASTMNAIVNEGFFGSAVLVVEGPSDAAAFWTLQELMGKAWTERGIVVVPAFGKNNLDRPVVIFEGFGIPTYFIFDADGSQKGHNKQDTAIRRNRIYLRLARAAIEDFPRTDVKDKWAVFGDNIEALLREELGQEAYENTGRAVCSDLGYEEVRRALKSPVGMEEMIRGAYRPGGIPTLEKIVGRVSALAG